MNAEDALGILGCQSSCSGHRIASMGSDNLLISFQAPDRCGLASPSANAGVTVVPHAPPEQSEPAITSIRFTLIFANDRKVPTRDVRFRLKCLRPAFYKRVLLRHHAPNNATVSHQGVDARLWSQGAI